MSFHNHDTDEYNKRFGPKERQETEEKEEGMIAKHLRQIKELGFYYELKNLLELQRKKCLESIMDTDFYRKHSMDFPKSYITQAPEPEELEAWKNFKPKES
jgi:hypothetical protein